MKRLSAAQLVLFVLFIAFFMAPVLWAKGDMVLIEVRAKALTSPIKITDPKIQEFTVWAGPGVNGAGLEDASGFIADWKQGAVAAPPAGLTRYKLSFYWGCRTIQTAGCPEERPVLCYVAFYAFDPASPRGFVYVPGRGEASYVLNVGTIYHGPRVEGHWFHASDAWERFARPIIATARRSN
jgi:hypothetical protein